MEQVILVDEQDNSIGLMEKHAAHINPHLHRAFSIFIFNSKGELLMQQRALSKYHSPGLWTNTCCSHPRNGETLEEATSRRLWEEMGLRCKMHEAYTFIYRAPVGQGLTEHEFDHVWIGQSDDIALRPCRVMRRESRRRRRDVTPCRCDCDCSFVLTRVCINR